MRPSRLWPVGLLALCAQLALADPYPAKPITMVVPTPPAGATDAVARAIADDMSKRLGQPIVIDNRPGATGMLGTQMVARAAPDGYTLLFTLSAPIVNAPFVYAKVPYDVRRDLAFISQIASASLVLAVGSEVPVRNMQEFIAWGQKNRGKLSYGSFGIATAGHLMGAYLNESQQLDMTHVAYKGEAPLVQDMVGGVVPWGIGSLGTMGPHIASGRLRALAVIGSKRLPELPGVPTMAEAGFSAPEFRPMGWFVLMAPAATPLPILQRLEKEVRISTQAPTVRARFQVFGLEAMGTTSDEFRRDYEAVSPVLERMFKASGVKPE